jgi:tetratricopeptide (TPR) repeat protein
VFVDRIDASETIKAIALKRRDALEKDKPAQAAMEEQVRFMLQFQFNAIREDWDEEAGNNWAAWADQQYLAVEACDRFLRGYPQSRYVANVLYLKGRAADIRLDRDAFWRTGVVKYYETFPNMASRPTWELLVKNHSESPLASVAMYRLGLLRARAGNVDGASDVLKKLVATFGDVGPQSTQPEAPMSVWQLFAKRPASSSLRVVPSDMVMQGRKLLAMIDGNRDPHQNDLALRMLLSCDSRDPMYVRNLRQLLHDIDAKYPLTALRDNIEVQLAATEPSRSLKIKALESCVQKLARDPDSDAYPQAQYELGLAYRTDNRMNEARAFFEDILSKRAKSPWALEAQRQLAELGATTVESSR